MSDDLELVQRLSAIDATPRANWVTALRADLDAAWDTEDTGYLDSLRTTTLTLDHEPARAQRSSGRRWAIRLVAAAAAVVAVAVVASRDDDATPAEQPSPTLTVPPTLAPRALPNSRGEQLMPGTYFVDEISGVPTPRIFVTVGAGWHILGGGEWSVIKREADADHETADDDFRQSVIGAMSFSHPVAVVSDACHGKDGYYPGKMTTLDGLVTALTEQRGWADVTAPSDTAVDGYAGKAFRRTAPSDVSDCDTVLTNSIDDVRTFIPYLGSWEARPHEGNLYEAGSSETLWVLDIDGTVVVISTVVTPGPSAGRSPDFAADVLDSIRIEPA